MMQKQISRLELASYLLCPSLFVMVALMVAEAMLAAATTWLVIMSASSRNGHPAQRSDLDPLARPLPTWPG